MIPKTILHKSTVNQHLLMFVGPTFQFVKLYFFMNGFIIVYYKLLKTLEYSIKKSMELSLEKSNKDYDLVLSVNE